MFGCLEKRDHDDLKSRVVVALMPVNAEKNQRFYCIGAE